MNCKEVSEALTEHHNDGGGDYTVWDLCLVDASEEKPSKSLKVPIELEQMFQTGEVGGLDVKSLIDKVQRKHDI